MQFITEKGNVGSHGTIDKYYSDGRKRLSDLRLTKQNADTQNSRDFLKFVKRNIKQGSGEIMTIAGMFVPEEYRKQSITTRLLKKALEIAKTKGAKAAVIYIENPEIANAFHNAGWKWIDSIESADCNTEVYVKYL